MKNLFVFGGSYFAGRAFSVISTRDGGCRLSLLNRGSVPLNLPGVTEYRCDRRDTGTMEKIVSPDVYDAVIDFCAYHPGYITEIFEHFPGTIRQYIYISTCSVYEQSDEFPKFEDAPLLSSGADDPVSQYQMDKLYLEGELQRACSRYGVPYTILRPAFLYGPMNYAPRESWLIEQIARKRPLAFPVDSLSLFQFTYVSDLARAILLCVGNDRAYDQIFNVCGPEMIGYAELYKQLELCNGVPFERVNVSVKEVYDQNIPLPYPLDVHELYSGEKLCRTLGFHYTPFKKGMQKTFEMFMSRYRTSN